MKFQLVEWINPGHCPECKGWSRRLWVAVAGRRTIVVCCEACGPRTEGEQS
jgi:hypothetical protein